MKERFIEAGEIVNTHGVRGRQGRVVKEIRVLMKAVAQRQGKKVSVEILD